jgi:hypothetical protein
MIDGAAGGEEPMQSRHVFAIVVALGVALLPAAANASVSWAIQPTPNPIGATISQLLGVSCPSVTACSAVGFSINATSPKVRHTLAERWNGTAWKIQPSPDRGVTGPGRGSSLSAVSCTSASACMAVGFFTNGALISRTLAERWNGTAWKIQPTLNPSASTASGLQGVSCTSATACTAVGFFNTRSESELTLAEQWNGTAWKIQPTPNPVGSSINDLTAVSCTSADACTAVGVSIGPTGLITLAERWDGTAWTIQPIPNPGESNVLNGVSCSSASSCTAVGSGGLSGLDPVAEQWNGTSWVVLPTPGPVGASDTNLTSVSCLSAGDCTAVGLTFTAGPPVVVAERWSGTTWVVQHAPSPVGATASILEGVSCTSGTVCTAAGDFDNPSGDTLTLAEHS